MEDRLRELERTVASILDRLERIENRLEPKNERQASVSPENPVPATSPGVVLEPSAAMFPRLLQVIGRTFLVLGGAFLMRALSDSGVLSYDLGIALAVALALGSVAFSHRAAHLGDRPSAAFHGISAALIAYPLAVETTTRLGVMSASTAAMITAGITALLLLVAWRNRLAALAWVGVASCLAATLALMQSTDVTARSILVLWLLTGATAWFAESSSWNGLRWPTALFLDLAVLRYLFSPIGAAEATSKRTLGLVFSLFVALLSLMILTYHTLLRRKPIGPFVALQTPAGIAIAVIAAIQVSTQYPWITGLAGSIALVLGLGASIVALVALPTQQLGVRNYLFYLVFSAGLVFLGATLVMGNAVRAGLWAVIGLVAAFLGQRLERAALSVYGAVFVWAGAISSGLFGAVTDAFLPTSQHWRTPGVDGVLVFAIGLAAYWLVAQSRNRTTSRVPLARAAASAILLLCALTLAALLVHIAGIALGVHATDLGVVATARTVALVAIATLLALTQKWRQWPELAWIAYAFLALAGVKLLVEDLPTGRALTLLVAFAAYGIGLIAIQKLLRPLRQITVTRP